jgi:hypothetical protein
VKSGVFFDEQTSGSIREAVVRFEHQSYDRAEVSEKVQGFGRKHFLEHMKNAVESHYSAKVRLT